MHIYSIDCYEMAQQLSTSLDMVTSDVIRTLKTHFGSAWNELGTYYMVMSSTLDYAQGKNSTILYMHLCVYIY